MTGLLIILVGGISAHATLLSDFFHGLWTSSDLAFFPLGLLVAGWLLWTRRLELLELDLPTDESAASTRRVRGEGRTTVIGLAITVLLVFISQVLHAPHLGWVSLLILLGTIAYSQYGAKGAYAVLPVLILLFFLKPIPNFFEPWLQLGLQWLVSRFASILLDFLRIFNFSEGVVLGLVGQEGLAEQVCHGVRWLYVAMFAAIAWGIHYRYHWFRIFLNVTSSIFWVVVLNALRVAVVLANQEWGGDWINSSAMLILIDFVCLGLILFFVWSGDQLLASIVVPRQLGSVAIDQEVDGKHANLAPAWQPTPMVWGLGFAFFFVTLMSMRLLFLHGSSWTNVSSDDATSNIEIPLEIEGWKVGELETRTRTLYDGTELQTKSWTLEREGKKLALEVDGPLPAYAGANWKWNWYGWKTSTVDVEETAAADGAEKTDASAKFATIAIGRLPGESGAVAACGMDRDGRILESAEPYTQASGAIAAFASGLRYALGFGSLEKARESTLGHPVRSVSLRWHSAKPLEPEQLKELSKVFRAILPTLTTARE